MPSLRLSPLAAPLAALLIAASARGDMVNFTYSGADPDDSYVVSTGPGSFSYAAGKTTVGLADLISFGFNFTVTSNDPSLKYSDTFFYKLGDLTSFSATISNSGLVTALSFRTGYESPPDQYLAPQYIVASSLKKGGVVSYFGPGDDAQHGTITSASVAVPLPASLALLAPGLALTLGLALLRRIATRPRPAA